MFERYSENARRVLFFSRYEAAQAGHRSIEPEQIVLGVLRDNANALMKFARADEMADTIRTRLESANVPREPVSTSVEIPFSPTTKDALVHTFVEADDLNNHWIRPEHIVLAVMVKTDGAAARVLRDAGVDPNAIRDDLRVKAGDKDSEPGAHTTGRTVAFAAPRGAVVRQWKGVVKPGKALEYVAHLRSHTIAALAEIEGFVTYSVMRRDVEDGVEFQVLTIWRSVDAIRAFAGEDATRAVVPPAAQALMVRYDERAVHYDIVQ